MLTRPSVPSLACPSIYTPFLSPSPFRRYAPVSGEYLLTASYDGTIKAWCGRDFSPLATLAGHDNKVTAVDIAAAPIGRHGPLSSSADSSSGGAGGSGGEGLMAPRSLAESTVVSVSFDRTIKLWAPGE
jgi:WD40 repeat protein